MRLTERSYWDGVHEQDSEASAPAVETPKAPWKRVLSAAIRKCGGDSYGNDWFWNRLLPKYVERKPGASVLEVGAAPGEDVLRFWRRCDYTPFGLEYSPAGAEATRRTFQREGIDPGNVIEGDLFDEALMVRQEARFDVVFSRGLIEHFTDPRLAIAQHVRLAKEQGLVVITIPTLTGIHYAMTRMLMPHQIPLHNLTIMRLREFRSLFEGSGLEEIHCGYGGGVNLLVSYTPHPAGYRRLLQALSLKLQVFGNMAGHAGLCRGPYLNWSLVFIGRKICSKS